MHDFVAIGDVVIDAFIRLKNAEVNPEHTKLTVAYGDKIPYESVDVIYAVGNSANAAVAASRLGLTSALVASVGDDDNGKKCIEALQKDKVDTQYILVDKDKPTNYHYVLWYEDDRTILVKHAEFKRVLPTDAPKWLYLSSLGADTLPYHEEIIQYLKNNPGIKLAFQPGTFQITLGKEKLKEMYEMTEIFFCNIEEAEKILGIDTLGKDELIKRMRDLGPKIVILTDGPRGAYAYDGENMYQQLPYPDPKSVVDRTGAGDAFASTTVVALIQGVDLPTALQWGAINSMSVVQDIGAQRGLLTREKLDEFLASSPTEFATKKLN